MDIPFLRALDLAAQSQLSKIKKQSKRLEKASIRVFGVAYTPEVCEAAIAAANGFRNWSEVQSLDKDLTPDKEAPFWEIGYRNEKHTQIFLAIRSVEACVSMDRPTIVLGELKNSIPAAVCLWVERISQLGKPGLISINTKFQTFQKTNVYQAAKELGLAQTFEKFRIVDTREPVIPLSITATYREWIAALKMSTSPEDWKVLEDARITANIYRLAVMHNPGNNESDTVGPHHLQTAIGLLKPSNHEIIDSLLPLVKDKSAHWYTALKSHFEGFIDREVHHHPAYDSEAFARMESLIKAINTQVATYGMVLRKVANNRPVVVLYDCERPESVAISALISEMFRVEIVNAPGLRTELHCATEEKRNIRPINSYKEVIIASGESDIRSEKWNESLKYSPTFIHANDDGLIASGKLAPFEP